MTKRVLIRSSYFTDWQVVASKHFDDILSKMGAGMSMAKALASIPGGPDSRQVQKYAAIDPQRAARLNAVAKPRKPYTASAYDAALLTLETSSTRGVESISVPGEPTYCAMVKRAERDPAFAERLRGALAARRAREDHRPTLFTEAEYERALFLISSQPDRSISSIALADEWVKLPSYAALFGRANRDHEFAERFDEARALHAATRFSDEAYDRALQVIGDQPRDPMILLIGLDGMPSLSTLRGRARRQDPFNERLKVVLQSRRAVRIVANLQAQSTANFADDLFRRIDKALPRYLDQRDRDDIRSEILESIIIGDLAAADIELKIKGFVTAHNREFSNRKFASLDQTFGEDNDTAFIDLLSADRWSMEGA